jgi:hypothetical protein
VGEGGFEMSSEKYIEFLAPMSLLALFLAILLMILVIWKYFLVI